MNKFFCSLTALFFSVISIAQEDVNYDDVAVIMNNNSSTSILIGEYFQEKRSIPDINMIYIDVPVEEVIDSAQFELMRSQIEEYITGNNLQDSLNYLVTTKGVPLRIEYGECEATTGGGPFDFPKCSSVDSELALMLEEYSDFINENGGLMNIYYEETNHFSRDEYGLYLVTRLSGHDIWDVKSLINRSGPNTPVADFGSNYVFDSFNWDMSGDSAWAADILAPAHDYVVAQGWNSVLATEVDFLTEQESVFGYYCVSATGNADTDSPDNVWVKGSVATVFVESSASTFNYDGADDRLLLADYIAEGACGGFGLANIEYMSMYPSALQFFTMYTDTSQHYNLAESYYSSIKQLSWQGVVIGDPKTSIIFDEFASLPPPKEDVSFNLYPNPNQGNFTLEFGELEVDQVQIFNLSGQVVHHELVNQSQKMDLQTDLTSGQYIISLIHKDGIINQKMIIQ